MRCLLSKKKINRLREETGLNIVSATVRGNTDHQIFVTLADGSQCTLDKNWELIEFKVTSPVIYVSKEWEEEVMAEIRALYSERIDFPLSKKELL
jgi:hypothetical protein